MNMSDMDISEPLKPAVFHILLALADQNRHGYGTMQAVREQSGGRVRLQTGSFYRHLTRLMDQGLVAETPARGRGVDARRGTYYRITEPGRQALQRERRYLTEVLASLRKLEPTLRKDPA
jgi:DNA-binding PadR family transcriptional regulator